MKPAAGLVILFVTGGVAHAQSIPLPPTSEEGRFAATAQVSAANFSFHGVSEALASLDLQASYRFWLDFAIGLSVSRYDLLVTEVLNTDFDIYGWKMGGYLQFETPPDPWSIGMFLGGGFKVLQFDEEDNPVDDNEAALYWEVGLQPSVEIGKLIRLQAIVAYEQVFWHGFYLPTERHTFSLGGRLMVRLDWGYIHATVITGWGDVTDRFWLIALGATVLPD